MKIDLASFAACYHHAGLCVLPTKPGKKRPSIPKWAKYQKDRPTYEEIHEWFIDGEHGGLCLVCGKISGNLEVIDFDQKGRAFEAWKQDVKNELPGLLDRLVLEQSPSGGFHALYRCEAAVGPNETLARTESKAVLIETRAEGGLILCAPTPGYKLLQGHLHEIPVITEEERETLLVCARMLDERRPEVIDGHQSLNDAAPACGLRPGDDFNLRGDIGPLLRKHGWRYLVTRGENEHWTRPGKDSGTSATFNGKHFYVFSSNATQFERTGPFDRFGVYARLEHRGDTFSATRSLQADGYGSKVSPMIQFEAIEAYGVSQTEEVGKVPESLLSAPGFISELMDYTLATAPYPNRALAFCGAMSLLAFLCGRKFCDAQGTRTNLYLIALANSGTGKERPRQVNSRVLLETGLESCLGDAFASGQGLEDALLEEPAMLFQTDEIDTLLSAIGRAKDDRYEALIAALLKFSTSASGVAPMRKKAGGGRGKCIVQPCLVIFGTAIPAHFYAAASERLLTNGFFGRSLVFEAGKRSKGQTPRQLPIPPRVIETAHALKELQAGSHRNGSWVPEPCVVQAHPDATAYFAAFREESDSRYAAAEARDDPIETTLRARTPEHAHRLALLYALSESNTAPVISLSAAKWACEVTQWQVSRMLTMAERHSGASPFEADCQTVIRKIRKGPNQSMPHWEVLKRTKFSAVRLSEMMNTLIERGDVLLSTNSTGGREARIYHVPVREER